MSKYLLSSVHVSQVHISYTAIANMITYDTIITIIVCAFVAAQFQSKASNANNVACLKVCFATFQLFSISNTSVVKLCFSDIHCNAGCFRSAQRCSKNVNRKHGIGKWVQ